MGKSKAADAPDVVGAAREEAEGNRTNTRDQTYANRPDQINAMGSLTYGQEQVRDPATGEMVTKWTQNQNMSPEMQRIYDGEMANLNSDTDLANGMNNRIQNEMGSAPDWAQFGQGRAGAESAGLVGAGIDSRGVIGGDTRFGSPERQRAEDDAYGRSTRRLDPQFEKQKESLAIELRNRGLSSGDQQYQAEMDSFSNGRNDAYEMARMGATSEGRTEDSQYFNQQMGANQNARAADQQNYGQRLSGAQNDRAADAQYYGQQNESAANANALRDKKIQEYVDKRGFSQSERDSLNTTSRVQGLSNAVTGGGGGGGS